MSGVRRRTFLAGGATAGAALALGRGTAEGSAPPAAEPSAAGALRVRVPFEGARQAGIATPKPRYALWMAWDAVADDRGALVDVFRTLSERARALTQGHRTLLDDPADGPTPESGILGVEVPPDALTVTVGVGASLFDGRYGLADRRPRGLTPMPTFPDDDLRRDQSDGDVLVQLCANSTETLLNAVRDLMRSTRGGLASRWTIQGFAAATHREPGAARNLLGFKDGSSNPDARALRELVWRPDGGTFQAVRVIRNRVEFWDRVGLAEQERMIGRRKDTGAPLGGVHERDVPDFAADPHGRTIPLDAHIRLARPRTPATESSRILRRGFNYSRGLDEAGQLDMGLVFVSFQRDLEQFAVTQRRLAGEPLVDYVVPTGGGYFYCPPGAADQQDWVGSSLLA